MVSAWGLGSSCGAVQLLVVMGTFAWGSYARKSLLLSWHKLLLIFCHIAERVRCVVDLVNKHWSRVSLGDSLCAFNQLRLLRQFYPTRTGVDFLLTHAFPFRFASERINWSDILATHEQWLSLIEGQPKWISTLIRFLGTGGDWRSGNCHAWGYHVPSSV